MNSRAAISRSNTQRNTRSRNNFEDNTAASGSNRFHRNSQVDHRRMNSNDIHNGQNDMTRSRQIPNVPAQSGFQETPIGNDVGNQGLTQDQQLVREMLLLNSLLSESGNIHHNDASSNARPIRTQVLAISDPSLFTDKTTLTKPCTNLPWRKTSRL